MEEKLIFAFPLDNGLEVKIYDASRKIAADRWYLKCIARIDVPVDLLEGQDENITVEAARRVLGDKAVFEQKQERNFISVDERDAIFQVMCDVFTQNLKPYFSHPGFAVKFLLKKYRTAARPY